LRKPFTTGFFFFWGLLSWFLVRVFPVFRRLPSLLTGADRRRVSLELLVEELLDRLVDERRVLRRFFRRKIIGELYHRLTRNMSVTLFGQSSLFGFSSSTSFCLVSLLISLGFWAHFISAVEPVLL
jgi:hypothetical protein